jgi:VWFA-related protein
MPSRLNLGTFLLCMLSAALFPILSASQSAAPAPPAPQVDARQPQTSQSGYVLKVTTRLVTVDLIATDSHGNPVRDLKPEDLQIFEEHKLPEKIEHFQFLEKWKGAGPAENSASANSTPPGVLSNQLPIEKLKIPPTVLLMDSLNTQTPNQLQGRAHMIQLLRTLPPDTPVAVFLLGSSLRILQGFTSDASLLRAALDQAVTGSAVIKDPRNDTKNTSSYIEDQTAGTGPNLGLATQLGEVQNFEKEEYAMSLDLRAKETLGAMAQIGQYLSGIPGRKILIWVSESFPISVAPDPDTGNNPFGGAREYSEQVKAVANVLTDAQVAVYPLDVRGVQAQQSLSASQNVSRPQTRMSGPDLARQLNAEDIDLQQSQGTMMEIAQDTGGKTCASTNDLSGCVLTALKDSSTYYELSFYPKNVNWDGRFHKITVKTSRPGVKLSYRRGFYALDASSLAKKQAPEDHLRQACTDQLPSTSIPLTVQSAPSSQSGDSPGGLQYMLLISAAGLGTKQESGSYNLDVRVADCEFAQKDTVFRYHEREMPKNVSAEMFRTWQSQGIPYHVTLMPAADTRRIRMVVLDVSSGLTGAIDIPVRAPEIAKAAPPAPFELPPPAPVATTPYVELPDKVKGSSPPKVVASLTFHLGAAASGTVDWSGDTVTYQAAGDMPLDKSASGFAGYAFGNRFHCQDGHFVPINADDGEPVLRFTFHNHSGKMVVVDLKGEQPVYLGDLSVDPSAQSFFEEVWKSSHCQQQ